MPVESSAAMHTLPPIVTPHGRQCWPLSLRTAERLTDVLLSPGEASRRVLLAAALEDDTAFAEWARAAASQRGIDAAGSDALAEWLARQPAGFFAPGESDEATAPSTDGWRPAGAWGNRLAALVAVLARMTQLQADFEGALEAAKLESLKELAYGAGHEINNPLANISARAQTLLADEPDPERRRMLASINAQAFRAHEMIADMMLFARPPEPRRASTNLRSLLVEVHAELLEQAEQQGTRFELAFGASPLEAAVDATQIAVAVRSLCLNSLEALVSGGEVRLELSHDVPGDAVRIVVRDSGPGIPESARPHIFDPFYSGREAGRGLGLGLSKCWRIVTMHGGRIDVASAAGGSTVFTLTLPRGNAG
jgi:signal transduction histidine kinase